MGGIQVAARPRCSEQLEGLLNCVQGEDLLLVGLPTNQVSISVSYAVSPSIVSVSISALHQEQRSRDAHNVKAAGRDKSITEHNSFFGIWLFWQLSEEQRLHPLSKHALRRCS